MAKLADELFERTFIQDAYSCISGRGTHFGINRLQQHIRQESCNYSVPCYVHKMDIRGYFMHIDRERLLEIALASLRKMAGHRILKHVPLTWHDKIDILLGIYDQTRMGALWLKTDKESEFLDNDASDSTPPITSLSELEQASWHLENENDPNVRKFISISRVKNRN